MNLQGQQVKHLIGSRDTTFFKKGADAIFNIKSKICLQITMDKSFERDRDFFLSPPWKYTAQDRNAVFIGDWDSFLLCQHWCLASNLKTTSQCRMAGDTAAITFKFQAERERVVRGYPADESSLLWSFLRSSNQLPQVYLRLYYISLDS